MVDAGRPGPPGPDDIAAAGARIAGKAVMTPLLNSPALDALAGARLLVKAENLQRTGSFKYRGLATPLCSWPRNNGAMELSPILPEIMRGPWPRWPGTPEFRRRW